MQEFKTERHCLRLPVSSAPGGREASQTHSGVWLQLHTVVPPSPLLTCTTECRGDWVGFTLPSSINPVATKLKPRKSWWAPALGGMPGESATGVERQLQEG